jgi:hypothetical protein
MNRRRIISIFLIITLSLQLLPLKQMVSWLIRNQVTEEIIHAGTDGAKNGNTPDEVHKYLHSFYFSFNILDKKISAMKQHEDEALYARFPDDILTPPPNV